MGTFDTDEHVRFSRETLSHVMAALQGLGAQLDPPEIFEAFP